MTDPTHLGSPRCHPYLQEMYQRAVCQLTSLTGLGMLTKRLRKRSRSGARPSESSAHAPGRSWQILATRSERKLAPETVTAAFGVARSPFGCSTLTPNSPTSQESAIPEMRESAPQFFARGWREQQRPRAQLAGPRSRGSQSLVHREFSTQFPHARCQPGRRGLTDKVPAPARLHSGVGGPGIQTRDEGTSECTGHHHFLEVPRLN